MLLRMDVYYNTNNETKIATATVDHGTMASASYIENVFSTCFHCTQFCFSFYNRFRCTLTEEGIELVITVMEAKELIGPANAKTFDTFVRIYLVPDESDAQQTKVS